jgi:hypothetical protein
MYFSTEDGSCASFRNIVFFLKNFHDGQSKKKKKKEEEEIVFSELDTIIKAL